MQVRNKLPKGWPVQVDEEPTDSSINHRGCKGVVFGDAQEAYSFPRDLEKVFCRFYPVKFDDGLEMIPDYCLESQKVRVTYKTPTGAWLGEDWITEPWERGINIITSDLPGPMREHAWDVWRLGSIEFDSARSEYVQTIVLKIRA